MEAEEERGRRSPGGAMEAEGLGVGVGVGEAGTEQESCLKSSHCLGCNVKAHIPHSVSSPFPRFPFFFFFHAHRIRLARHKKKKKKKKTRFPWVPIFMTACLTGLIRMGLTVL